MSESLPKPNVFRRIRRLLIKNGFGEDEADAAIDKLWNDLSSQKMTESDRLTILQKIVDYVSRLPRRDLIIAGIIGPKINDILNFAISRIEELLNQSNTTEDPAVAKAPIPPKASAPGTARQYLESVIEQSIIETLTFDDRDLLIFLTRFDGKAFPPSQPSMPVLGGCAAMGKVYHNVERSWRHLKQRLGISWPCVEHIANLDISSQRSLIEYFCNTPDLFRFGESLLVRPGAPYDLGLFVSEVSATVDMRFRHHRIHCARWTVENCGDLPLSWRPLRTVLTITAQRTPVTSYPICRRAAARLA